ncbi:MAG: hypothetical protein ACLVJ6_11955 [Merdibacter sp.]
MRAELSREEKLNVHHGHGRRLHHLDVHRRAADMSGAGHGGRRRHPDLLCA